MFAVQLFIIKVGFGLVQKYFSFVYLDHYFLLKLRKTLCIAKNHVLAMIMNLTRDKQLIQLSNSKKCYNVQR